MLQTELKDKFADEILFGSLLKGGTVHVDAGGGDGELVLSFTPRSS